MNKARITYRLDNESNRRGERQRQSEPPAVIPLHQEEYQVVEESPSRLNQYTSDFGTWKSPFDEETERIERMIRETNERNHPEVNRAPDYNVPHTPIIEEEQTDHPQERWNGAYIPPYEEQPVVTTTRYVRYSKPPWVKIISSVAAAVATGVLLGFFVLSMFDKPVVPTEPGTKGQAEQGPPAAAAANGPEAADPAGAAGQAENGSLEAAVQTTAGGADVNIAAKTYSVLQNGIFSSAEGAQTAQEDLRSKGLAGVTEQTDKHYVYAGIAADRNDALNLGKELQGRQIEIYVKNYSLPALTKVNWPGSIEGLENYLALSDQMVQIISGMTAVHLEEESPTPMDSNSLQSLKERHEGWSGAASTVAKEASEEVKPILQKLDQAMNTALQSIDQYTKNPSTSMLWEAQTSLMNFVLTEKQLLETIAVK